MLFFFFPKDLMTSVAWLMISVCLVLTLPSFPLSHSSFFQLPSDRMGIFHVEEWQCGWSELPTLSLLFPVPLKRSFTMGLSPSGLPSPTSVPLHPSVIHTEPGWKIPYFLFAFFFFSFFFSQVIFNSDLSSDPAGCTAREIPPRKIQGQGWERGMGAMGLLLPAAAKMHVHESTSCSGGWNTSGTRCLNSSPQTLQHVLFYASGQQKFCNFSSH